MPSSGAARNILWFRSAALGGFAGSIISNGRDSGKGDRMCNILKASENDI